MQGLLQRQSVVLSHPKWLAQPWQSVHKSTEQKVYDHGLILAGLFEKVDMLSKPGLDDKQCLSVLKKCANIQEGIERIIKGCLQSVRVYNDDPTTNDGRNVNKLKDAEAHESRAVLLLRIVAMGIELGACTSGCKAYLRLISNSRFVHINEETVSTPSCGISQTGIALCRKQRSLAKAIVRSIATYITGRNDLVCNAKLIFPLKQAIEQLEPEDKEHAECVVIMQKLRTPIWQFGVLVRPMDCSKNISSRLPSQLVRLQEVSLPRSHSSQLLNWSVSTLR